MTATKVDPNEIASMSLIKKLAKIRAISDVVSKEKEGYGYTYASITSILAKITAGMKKYNVSLLPSIVPGTEKYEPVVVKTTKFKKNGDPYTKEGTEYIVSAEMLFTWINDDNPEDFIKIPWYVIGSQSDPSQAFGSGLTYNTRYFLCNYFQIAQEDNDVDAYRSKQKAAEESEDRAIAEGIVGEIDKTVSGVLAGNPEVRESVIKFIARYVKGANYKLIKDPAVASKLLNDFKKEFIDGNKGKEQNE